MILYDTNITSIVGITSARDANVQNKQWSSWLIFQFYWVQLAKQKPLNVDISEEIAFLVI